MLVKSTADLIGRTPLLEIDPAVHGLKKIRLFAKLEHLNPFGSIKDRSALGVLGDDLARISDEKRTVVESSSGNMAKALSVLCAMSGVPFRIVSSKIQVGEVKQILQLLGAEIEELPALSACPDPSDPNNPVAYIDRMVSASPDKYHHTSQFTNDRNRQAHFDGTGPEIQEDAGQIDYFFAGLGTTGSSRGAGEYLKSKNKKLKTIGIVAPRGESLPGIRSADEMFEVGLFDRSFYDEILEISTEEALDAMLVLIRQLGVLAGPTSGANFASALKYLRKLDRKLKTEVKAAFIVCDRVEWYLSYIRKHRPEIFGVRSRQQENSTVSKSEIDSASEISVSEFETWKKDAAMPLIVDMRGGLAFKAGHIPGSINIPQDNLEEMLQWGAPFSNNHKVLLVCPTGDHSRRFAAIFSKLGIDATSLKGGFISWRDKKGNLERSGSTSGKVKKRS